MILSRAPRVATGEQVKPLPREIVLALFLLTDSPVFDICLFFFFFNWLRFLFAFGPALTVVSS